MDQSNQGNKVQLGCGTLILIAVIVMLFSGRDDTREMSRQIEKLNAKIDRLEKKIDLLSAPQAKAAVPAPAAPKPAQ